MSDSSTTARPILDQIAGDCWARRQLRSGIKDVSVASKLMKSLTLVWVVFIGTLAIPELDGRFLHDHISDPESDCGRSLGSMPATQWYKVRPCHIKTQEIAVFCGGWIQYQAGDILLNGRYLHSRWTDFDYVCSRVLGSMPATQWYKVRPCRIKTHELADPCEGCLYMYPGNPRTRWQMPPQRLGRSWT